MSIPEYPHVTLDVFVAELTRAIQSFSLDLIALTAAGIASGLDKDLLAALVQQSMNIDPNLMIESITDDECVDRLKEMGL